MAFAAQADWKNRFALITQALNLMGFDDHVR